MRIPPLPGPLAPITPERLARRAVGDRPAQVTAPITVDPYDPEWPAIYAGHETTIRGALGERALAVEHVGSTAVPGLPAKSRIDIDLIVSDPGDEDAYVPALAAVGFTLRTREPDWYGHRCLWTDDHGVNLHVFGPDCDEHLRHLIFRDRLRSHPGDRDLYAAAKGRAAAANRWDMAGYVQEKGLVIVDVLRRAGLR
jgi:GrpB-like predicted nucleotidyltransferase (UPF0157 family)